MVLGPLISGLDILFFVIFPVVPTPASLESLHTKAAIVVLRTF